MKKKVISIVLTLAALLALAVACGSRTEDLSAHKVGVLYYSFDDAFLTEVRINLNDELTSLRIPYENYDAHNDQAAQNRQKPVPAGFSSQEEDYGKRYCHERESVFCCRTDPEERGICKILSSAASGGERYCFLRDAQDR